MTMLLGARERTTTNLAITTVRLEMTMLLGARERTTTNLAITTVTRKIR
jgi:hypothetical protein